MIEKILVPLDGSKASLNAIAALEEIVEARGRVKNIHLLYITTFKGVQAGGKISPDASIQFPVTDKEKLQAEAYLRRKAEDLQAKGFPATWEVMANKGKLSQDILEVAETKNMNMIVMCTHGRTGFGALFPGSVASQVVALSKVPVTLIRPACQASDWLSS